jgi:hypothetical protein
MDEPTRRSLSELIGRAAENDTKASTAIEEMILAFDRAGAVDDVAAAMDLLASLAPRHLYNNVLTRLQANDHLGQQQWPKIG